MKIVCSQSPPPPPPPSSPPCILLNQSHSPSNIYNAVSLNSARPMLRTKTLDLAFWFIKSNEKKAPKPNRLAYEKLVSAKQNSPRKSQEKWCVDCNLQCSKTIDWEIAYKLPFCSTKATKLIIFQFKLLHRRLATNDFLNKIGIRENGMCTFQ